MAREADRRRQRAKLVRCSPRTGVVDAAYTAHVPTPLTRGQTGHVALRPVSVELKAVVTVDVVVCVRTIRRQRLVEERGVLERPDLDEVALHEEQMVRLNVELQHHVDDRKST